MPLQDDPKRRQPAGPRRRRWSDAGTPTLDADTPWSMADQWPVVVGALAADQLEFLRLATGVVDRAAAAGCIGQAEAHTLRQAAADLRHTSLRAQQVTRLANGRIRQYRESLDLGEVVRAVLRDRSGGTSLSQAIAHADLLPVRLVMDAAMAYTIVDGAIAWMFARCREIVIRTEPARGGDDMALLLVTGRRPEAPAGDGAARRRRLEDGLDLVLARQAADAAGLAMHLRQDGPLVGMSVLFPQAAQAPGLGLPAVERAAPPRTPAPEPASLHDWVLVITTDTGLVSSAAFGLGRAGFETRGAQTAGEARTRLREAPIAIVLDQDAKGGEFDALRQELLAPGGPRPLIEIVRGPWAPNGPAAPVPGECPKVARNDVVPDIAPTLLLELAKTS